jgi:hypothetical protein
MSLTFTLPAPELLVGTVLAPNTEAATVGASPDPSGPFPVTPTRLGQPGVTTRPIEVWAADDALHVRLPTNGACIDTSRLGLSVLAAAARASEAPITDEEGQTFADADAFLAHYDEAWCVHHARFGLETMAQAMAAHPGAWALMPTFDGDLTVRPERVQASRDAMALFASLRRRAWMEQEAPAFPTTTAILGAEVGARHEAKVYEVVLGERGWVGNTVGWARVDGEEGVLPLAELIDAYGDHAELIDDGCVLLGAVTGQALATVREAALRHIISDLGLLMPIPRASTRDPAKLLPDMELAGAASCLLHPAHARELLAARNEGATRIDDLAQAGALPRPVRQLLALAPVRAAMVVAAADGTVDFREKMAIIGSTRSQWEGPMKQLWRAAYADDDESWAEELSTDPTAPLMMAIDLATTHLLPAARAVWCDGVMARAEATANASGGFLGFFGNRVGPEEREVLDGLKKALDQSLRMP